MKMNPEVKAKWLEALRSGNYRQTGQRLHRGDDRFCCLGVLCDISGLGAWEDHGYVLPGELGVYPAMPPPAVTAWAGLNFSVGLGDVFKVVPELRDHQVIGTLNQDQAIQLSGLNDMGATFEQIATVIEVLL